MINSNIKEEQNTLNNLVIKNISNAKDEFLAAFYKEINGLDKKLVDIINSKHLTIILANKLSDVITQKSKNDIELLQDYHPDDRDITTRGLCSDTINAICLFSDVIAIQNIGAILYHEAGHLLDFYVDWGKENIKANLSSKKEFIEAYKQDITSNWEKIKNDNRFRLKHYIQNSTPDNLSQAGLTETFAHCFARINNKFDDVDILGEYFENSLIVSKGIYTNFLEGYF